MCGGRGALVPLFWLLVTFALDFKSRVDPLTCVLFCLISMDSSDSPLVQDLLTSRWSAWQPSPFYPLAFQSLMEANRCCASKAGAILESLLTKVQKKDRIILASGVMLSCTNCQRSDLKANSANTNR